MNPEGAKIKLVIFSSIVGPTAKVQMVGNSLQQF